ncbi:MAG: hypothetical protein D6761_03915 [Candidatus Dadabacteria bacterium]|nr:MAG: hypothetical protein D6761_03915 [Candidatus Dadabacteria bacterium]
MRKIVRRPSESGQGMLEYVLIVVFIAVAGVVVWRTFGDNIRALVVQSNDAIIDQTAPVLNGSGNTGMKSLR